MDAQRENIRTTRRKESPETVRRQQKELRRIRQRARRNSMTEEQIVQRRERGREYYIRRKNLQYTKEHEKKNASLDQIQEAENHMLKPCTTAEHIKQLRVHDLAYQFQKKRNLEVQQPMKETEVKSMPMDQQRMDHAVQSNGTNMIFHNKRLTHVKREARALHNHMISESINVRSPRVIHIRREARKLNNGVVDRSDKNRVRCHKHGNFLDNNGSVSRVQEHAQILIDISRMNGCNSTSMVGISGGPVKTDLNKRDVENTSTPCVHVEESFSDSDEVLAFLMDLSAKKG